MAYVMSAPTPDGKWTLWLSTSLDAVDGWMFYPGVVPGPYVPGFRVSFWRPSEVCPPLVSERNVTPTVTKPQETASSPQGPAPENNPPTCAIGDPEWHQGTNPTSANPESKGTSLVSESIEPSAHGLKENGGGEA